jgi:hypothetical protein
MQFLPDIAYVRRMSRDAFVDHCEAFAADCDLTRSDHRQHAGDLIKIALESHPGEQGRDVIREIADALICS